MDKPGSFILSAVQSGRRSLWQLLRVWPYSIKELAQQLERLHAEGWIRPTAQGWSEIALTEEGKRRAAERPLGLENVCPHCQGKGVQVPSDWTSRFNDIVQNRPLPVAKYDQGFMRAEDAVARVAFIHRMGDLARRDLLLIGDDDLVSIALAITGLAGRIAVIDIDDRLQEFIERANREYQFDIEFHQLDLRQPLPPEFLAQFDTFITDPVETLPGIELFLSRAASSLRGRDAAGYFGLTTLEASRQKWHHIESLLLRMNLVVTDILRDFSIYPEKENQWEQFYTTYEMMILFGVEGTLPDCDWYRSSFIRVEAIAEPRPTIEGTSELSLEELYLDDETVASPHQEKH